MRVLGALFVFLGWLGGGMGAAAASQSPAPWVSLVVLALGVIVCVYGVELILRDKNFKG